MRFIDSHCHLDFPELSAHPEYTDEAHRLGIEHFIVPGVHLAQCRRLLSWQQARENVSIALGLHPCFLTKHTDQAIKAYIDLAELHVNELVAIGECGIDQHQPDIVRQEYVFQLQVELANSLKLPIIVHHRKSHHLIAKVFKSCPPQYGGVIHAFSGSLQQAETYLSQGLRLGIGGTITYPRAAKTRNVVSELPLTGLLLETDAPDMPICGYQGEMNRPARLYEVFSCLVALRTGESRESIATQLYQNTQRLFGLSLDESFSV